MTRRIVEAAVLVSETGFLLAVRRVEIRVVVDFARAADAGVERLRRLVVSLQRVRIEQVSPFRRERQAALVVAQVHRLDEALVAQVFEGVVVDVEVVFGHDAKGADGGQRAAVFAVQLVDAVTVNDQLALVAARQVEVAHQAVARIVVPVAFVVHARAAVLPLVTVARIISRIEHGCPPDMALRLGCP